MFEEIAVWKRVGPKVAVRYVGFRNLETSRIWIAYGNYIGLDADTDLDADSMIAARATTEYFLNAFPFGCRTLEAHHFGGAGYLYR